MKKNSLKGFTLLEVVLSVSVIALIAGLSAPFIINMQKKTDLIIAVQAYNDSLHRAALLASGVKEDSKWGVKYATGSITIFKGDSYSNRDTNFDEIFYISTNISTLGNKEIIYNKLTGYPTTSYNTTFFNNLDSYTIEVNSIGTVNVEKN